MNQNTTPVLYETAPHPGLAKASKSLRKLLHHEPILEEDLAHLKALFSKTISGDWIKDINAIEVSIRKFFNLSRHYMTSCQEENTQAEFWNHARHDLRACVGCVKGYSELLLEDQGDFPEISAVLRKLMTQSVSLLDIIDTIRFEAQVVEEVFAPEASHEEHASCFVGSFVSRGTILIIDDDPTKRSLIVRRLEDGGHKALEAEGGLEGLHILGHTSVDLILLDILMPGMNGHEVLSRLKSNAQTKHIPVLVISHLSNEDNAIQCIRAGAEDYLIAPVNPTLLQARVNACLIKKNLADKEKKQSRELAIIQKRLESALQSIDVGFAILDKDAHFVMHNGTFENLYPGLRDKKESLVSYEDFLRKSFEEGRYFKEKRGVLLKVLKGDPFSQWLAERLCHFKKADGAPLHEHLSDGRWIEIIHRPIEGGGTTTLHKDITHQKNRETATLHRADHDALTGLANRAFFERTLEKACAERETSHGLIFIDLDGFKAVNDTLGHGFGDFLLTRVGQKLKAVVREEDMVGRLGGDEFCVFLKGVKSRVFLEKLANRCLESVGTFVEKDGVRANFGMSMGIAMYPADGKNAKDMLVAADSAMYHAKKSGKGTYVFYEDLEK